MITLASNKSITHHPRSGTSSSTFIFTLKVLRMAEARGHDRAEDVIIQANDSTRKAIASENRADNEAVDGATGSLLNSRKGAKQPCRFEFGGILYRLYADP
jgi:hypothetical protein